jgi:hypothetical protein
MHWSVMSANASDKPIIPFAPTQKSQAGANQIADDSGLAIIALLPAGATYVINAADAARTKDIDFMPATPLNGSPQPQRASALQDNSVK